MKADPPETPKDFARLAYSSEPEVLIEAARTGFWGKGRKLSDREIIAYLTSQCHDEAQVREVAKKYAQAMGWSVESFVEEARKIGRYGMGKPRPPK